MTCAGGQLTLSLSRFGRVEAADGKTCLCELGMMNFTLVDGTEW